MNSRLAMFIPSLSAGGLENAFLSLAEGLANKGWNVDCIVMQGGGVFEHRLPNSVRLIDLNSRAYASVIPLVRYLRQERPSHLIAFSEPCNFSALIARWVSRVPVIVIATSWNMLSISVKYTTIRRERLYPFFARWLYPFADLIIADSKGVADQDLGDFLGISPEKVEVVYNPLPISQIQAKGAEHLAHPWFSDTADQTPVILGVGRLEMQKDFATLLRAFADLRKQKEAHLCIVGDGSQADSLRQIVQELNIKDDVYFAGFDPNPFKYMSRAEVFVLSSVHEGFGNVIVEALACGCNVVSTDCPSGPSEILDNGCYGRLTPVGDVEAMAENIIATLQSPVDDHILKQRAMFFDERRAVDAYDRLLKDLDHR